MNKSQRASETQSRQLKQSIANIRKEISPVPTVSSVGTNPRAKPLAKARWLRRSVRVTKSVTSGSIDITFNDIGLAMGQTGTETYSVKVLGMKAWNVTGPATTSNSISVQVPPAIISASASGISAEDYGNGGQLAGVKINIPDLLAVTVATSSLTALAAIITFPFAGSSIQHVVVDFDIMYQT